MTFGVIDNHSKTFEELKTLLSQYSLIIQNYEDLDLSLFNKCDAVILTGGHDFPVWNKNNVYKKEMEFIAKTDIPILGICLGCEMIASVFGGSLKKLEVRLKQETDVEIIKKDPIFEGMSELSVFSNHKWTIDQLSGDLVLLARSESGPEVIKHRQKLIYGLQFHPELEPRIGGLIIDNFCKIASG